MSLITYEYISTRNWRDNAYTDRKVAELKTKRSKIYWLLIRNFALSFENKLLLYKVILKPVLVYGAQIWGQTYKFAVHELQVFQNDRTMCCSLLQAHHFYDIRAAAHLCQHDIQYVHEVIREAAKRLDNHDYYTPIAISQSTRW